jgi:hypothetical protein
VGVNGRTGSPFPFGRKNPAEPHPGVGDIPRGSARGTCLIAAEDVQLPAMKVPIVLSLAAIIAGLASARPTTNYDDYLAKGYRWLTVDGPYACVSKDDLRQIIKSRNAETGNPEPGSGRGRIIQSCGKIAFAWRTSRRIVGRSYPITESGVETTLAKLRL